MTATSQRVLIWMGLAMSMIWFGAYALLMGFFPPPPPSMPAVQVVELYTQHITQFRIGVVLTLVFCGFNLPWGVVFSVQLARREKGVPIWAIMQGLASVLSTVLFFLPPIFWAVAAFSPERDPAITLLMHELAFLTFLTPIGAFPLQLMPIVVVALTRQDKDDEAFPRWVGWLSLWVMVAAEPAVVAVMFKAGPFAWNNLFPFWVPIGIFGPWMGALIYTLLRAIKRQEQMAMAVK